MAFLIGLSGRLLRVRDPGGRQRIWRLTALLVWGRQRIWGGGHSASSVGLPRVVSHPPRARRTRSMSILVETPLSLLLQSISQAAGGTADRDVPPRILAPTCRVDLSLLVICPGTQRNQRDV